MLDRMPCRITDDPMSDPDYPRGIYLDLTRYWVELLDDTGLQWGFAIEAYDEVSAEVLAFAEAKEHGLRPAEIVSITENDE